MRNSEFHHELPRKDLEITGPYDYYCLTAPGEWAIINALSMLRDMSVPKMSLRLSTGLIGELDCYAGNRGTKNHQHIIIGLGENGIDALLKLGGLPCISCHSGRKLTEMNSKIKHSLSENVGELSHATDDDWLKQNYDSRRLNWNEIIALGIAPSRFYTRPGLSPAEVAAIADIFIAKNVPVPKICCYERDEQGKPKVKFYEV